jgi:Flavodoxins
VKALIAYYSRTGKTEKVGKIIGDLLSGEGVHVEFEKIAPLKADGLLKSSFKALLGMEVPILNTNLDVSGFDLVIVGSPVWAGQSTPPVNSYLEDIKGMNGKKAGVFVTTATGRGNGVVKDISGRILGIGGKTVAQSVVSIDDLNDMDRLKDKLKSFVTSLIAE